MGGVSDRTGTEGAEVPFGTYFDATLRRTCLAGVGILLALGGAAVFLGLVGEIAWLDGCLAALLGVIGAAWIWSIGVRPRLEVGPGGLVVINAVRTIEIPWAEVSSFDCQDSLVLCRRDGSSVMVAALPASGLRRIISATPGRVDRLAIQLNAYVAELSGPGSTRARVSIETSEGRRDIRVLAGIAVLGVGAAAVLRQLVG